MLALLVPASIVQAQNGPLRIEITEGVIEPMPFAVPGFVPDNGAAAETAQNISRLIAADLAGTGLFREIPANAHIGKITDFNAPIQFADWKAVNAQALITGGVSVSGNKLVVRFRVWDVFSGAELGSGLQFAGTVDGWRRMGHKVADQVYSRITGESGYFDSRVVFVSETGPKNDRRKRLAIMDYDGANVQYLTDSSSIVLAPRFSPTGDRVLYTSYETGFPKIHVLDVGKVQRRVLDTQAGTMSFAPRFAPDGRTVV
jgi:TolB protein